MEHQRISIIRHLVNVCFYQLVVIFITTVPGFLVGNPCEHSGRLTRLATPGYYNSDISTQETLSESRCGALCLENPACTAISVKPLTPSLSTHDRNYRVTCALSDGAGEYVPDTLWNTYTLMGYKVIDGTCEPRIRAEMTTTEPTTTPKRTCPVPEMGGGCYIYHGDPISWNAAKVVCESETAHLLTLTTLMEHNQMTNTLLAVLGPAGTIHGGAQDTDNNGVWEWVNGENFDFTHWDTSSAPVGGCLVVSAYPNKWTSGSCSDVTRAYMCEIDI